jgi:hypothetical protein
MSKFIVTSNDTFLRLHAAGVINVEPDNVRRCIIDLEVGQGARIYLETFADDAIIGELLGAGLRPEPDMTDE